ncbi:hypothetical protein BIV57_15595 [Mangrovactinospora gilvigrisea]|uniref:Aminoglycoside phosphotransferase domain-containing protein n=1 Tax=Mangrovactinospora gilvigrisea TaxID=1428644 RepID=A0A1J7BSY5_9ACTN|nr:hypothetical protein [Mangrovactinospora gilvigrisea]OIV36577.1 hypothetical protein BIV57_15595 [Mangrovactinospora gilvigrisea]
MIPTRTLQRAGELLGSAVADATALSTPTGRALVARLALEDGRSAILKCAFRPGESAPSAERADWFRRETAALAFLDGRAPVARLLASDAALGLALIEDFGPTRNLAHVLLSADRAGAERALAGYTDALADLHLATFDRIGDWSDPVEPLTVTLADGPAGDLARAAAALLGTDEAAAAPDQSAVARIDERAVRDPGPYRAFSLGDMCPDNNVVAEDGTVRFFDAEGAAARHALLDLAYLGTTMPSCWCVRRLPASLGAGLVNRYRARLHAAGRATPDFDAHYRACRAFWALLALSWDLPTALDAERGAAHHPMDDYDFELPSRRERVLLRLTELADAASAQPELAPLGPWAKSLASAARRAWRPLRLLPLYPAFG